MCACCDIHASVSSDFCLFFWSSPRYAASGGLQWIPAARGGAPAVASEVPDEDGVHGQSDQAARGAVRDHGLPRSGDSCRPGEAHRAERGDRQGESDMMIRGVRLSGGREEGTSDRPCVKSLHMYFITCIH